MSPWPLHSRPDPSRWAPGNRWRSSRSTPPTPHGGVLSTGRSRWRHRIARFPGTMRRASRSGDVPSDIRSGVGRHRPTPTRVIVVGIGPSRPDRMPGGVRNPAPTGPDRAPDARRRAMERKRETSVPNTVRGTRLSTGPGNRTHSRSVFRDGVRTDMCADHYPCRKLTIPSEIPCAAFCLHALLVSWAASLLSRMLPHSMKTLGTVDRLRPPRSLRTSRPVPPPM